MENNQKVGIIKGFDKLGRIVIPKELRERFYLSDAVEIVVTVDGILLKNPEYELVKKKRKIKDTERQKWRSVSFVVKIYNSFCEWIFRKKRCLRPKA